MLKNSAIFEIYFANLQGKFKLFCNAFNIK
jgi:hypothetical protein